MSNGIKVAVIDDGIHEYYFENVSLHENIEITPQLNIKPGHRDVYCDSYHGTICAAIISQFSEAAVELNSIKILATDRGRGT
jgi:subtilisin family serine protease